jgi:hypothetical protein
MDLTKEMGRRKRGRGMNEGEEERSDSRTVGGGECMKVSRDCIRGACAFEPTVGVN